MTKKIDTRAIGLEVGSELATWLTGAPNLHYGLWDGLDVNAGNMGAAQTAYTDKLLGYLPGQSLSILDIGGGAGVTAKRLISLGHRVTIVVPSSYLAEQCRKNAPQAPVYEKTFEAFESGETYDLCLFSESFQYIPLDTALTKALAYTKPGGHILISDCFRSENMTVTGVHRPAGGGHPIGSFRAALAKHPVEELKSEDITTSVAPSIDLEQSFFNIFGTGLHRIDGELALKKPTARRMALFLLRLVMGQKKLDRLHTRLTGNVRTGEDFIKNNRYLMMLLKKTL